MNSLTDKIALTDEQIEEAFDKAGVCIAIEDLTVTAEAIEDFKSARAAWATKGFEDKDTATVYVVRDAQQAKGQQRFTLAVIDFGDVRAVFRA
jgi:glucan biosynthesis protein